jgi:hypothetical protein
MQNHFQNFYLTLLFKNVVDNSYGANTTVLKQTFKFSFYPLSLPSLVRNRLIISCKAP